MLEKFTAINVVLPMSARLPLESSCQSSSVVLEAVMDKSPIAATETVCWPVPVVIWPNFKAAGERR